MQDEYWSSPQGTFEERRQAYLTFSASDSSEAGFRVGFFSQIARLALGLPVDEAPIREGIAFVDSRRDCCDFAVGGLLRILYLYDESPNISRELIADIEACLLRFKYWWDEPKGDNNRCYHTENHQIIFHSDELLAGQRFKDRVFSNNDKDGRYHIDHALHYIRRWLDFRVRFGYSEWLSHCYFEEDLLALVNLYDFAEDPEIRRQAKLQIDIILFEMALHTYRGVFGSTHGRTYAFLIKGARREGSASTAKLMFGMGLFNNPSSLGTIPLATSSYRCPPIFEKIAADLDESMTIRERHSLNVDDAPGFGLSYDSLEDGHLYWSVQDYTHPSIYDLAQRVRQLRSIMLYENYDERYEQIQRWQIEEHGEVVDRDIDCHAMTEVHVETYRTPDYMLSCAQDYRPGKPGYQQHVWQATLGPDAVIFTNHPGADDERSRPNYWAGNGILPRAAQHQNVLVCITHLPDTDAFPFTHAYFPTHAFDEVTERGGWIFGRKGEGYVALYSSHPGRWLPDGELPRVELQVDALDNVWICEMGRKADWGGFAAFVDAVSTSPLLSDGLALRYHSPSLGEVTFGWEGPLTVAGKEVPLRTDMRFDNPYCHHKAFLPGAEGGAQPDRRRLQVTRGGETLTLDFNDQQT
jgi:hypothetical protein